MKQNTFNYLSLDNTGDQEAEYIKMRMLLFAMSLETRSPLLDSIPWMNYNSVDVCMGEVGGIWGYSPVEQEVIRFSSDF